MGRSRKRGDELTDLQKRFVDEYLIDLNGAAAATRAGYRAKDAASMGSYLVKVPRIAQSIKERQEARAAKTDDLAARVIAEIEKLAFASLGDIVETGKDGNPRYRFDKATPGHMASISGLDIDEYMDGHGENARQVKKVKVRYHNKVDALTLLAKHCGIIDKRHEQPTEIRVTFGDD